MGICPFWTGKMDSLHWNLNTWYGMGGFKNGIEISLP
jgi:hypothetical protein